MKLLVAPVLIRSVSVLAVSHPDLRLLGVIAMNLALLLALGNEFVLILLPLPLSLKDRGRVFANRGHVLHPIV